MATDLSEVHVDMADAEGKVRSALNAATPAARCRAVMDAYWQTPEAARDAFVLVLAGNLTLRAPDRSILPEGVGFDPPTEGVGTEPLIPSAARGLS